ncbi:MULTISPECIES: aspartate kinase [Vibrio]|uniref:aspartate kinase n=2 Tax=Vibrio TaxID=662 RepID=A0A7X4LJ98_9VIBR|nr:MULTISPECIES: aspartate kinase [Vibrio]MBF9002821.1 aspartate kinase [Vibrio nitrifigilis]MZI92959.1 aspartate kinase [Vibrio eleionomae]
MSFTVEKIGGTSMSAFDAVLDNIFLKPSNPYHRVFVVSAYSGMTNALLECKKTGKPGIYQMVANGDENWQDAMYQLEQRMLLINENLFADPMVRIQADKFLRARVADAIECIHSLLQTCEFGQFSLRQYLPQIREFLSSLGEAHSAYNTVQKLQSLNINARFIDLSGWNQGQSESLDKVILKAFANIDLSNELPIVTGYAHCQEGLMQTYDRGYSEMTFSRIAALMGASEAIIHKEYHLSSADPCIVGPEHVRPMGQTNYDVADQLANLGMEAIHPNAAAGLRQKGIDLRIKNTFEPDHPGTLIADRFRTDDEQVEIIAGRDKVFALHLFDQSMVGKTDSVSYDVMEIISDEKVRLMGNEMNANSMTYFLSGSTPALNRVLARTKQYCPNAKTSGRMVALISAIGAYMNTNATLSCGMQALMEVGIDPMAAYSSMRNVNVQYVVEDNDYHSAICALHKRLIGSGTKKKSPTVQAA